MDIARHIIIAPNGLIGITGADTVTSENGAAVLDDTRSRLRAALAALDDGDWVWDGRLDVLRTATVATKQPAPSTAR
jgi:hypothetical protein